MLRSQYAAVRLTSALLLLYAAAAELPHPAKASATEAASAANRGRLTARDENAVQRARAAQFAEEANSATPQLSPAATDAAPQAQSPRGTEPEPVLLRELKSEMTRSGVPAASHLKVIVGLGLLLLSGYVFLRWLSREK